MKKNKGFTLLELIVSVAIVVILAAVILATLSKKADACFFCSSRAQNEVTQSSDIQKNLVEAVPIPQLSNSLERENVAKRAELFNTPDKISYIYLVNYGKVMAFYTVKGKVSSLQSYMIPTERLIRGNGEPCDTQYSGEYGCYTVAAPDIDGTYGENVEGIFFFTTEGAYVEWHGDYMMSDQPLKLTTSPELIREIK